MLLAGGPLRAGEACRELQQQRDQLAREAMQAEIALLQTLRRRLCPELERQAADANALTPARPDAPLFHYGAWIACRRQAEWQLERSRPVLYRNRRGFTFYSLAGAGTARQADAVEAAIHERCSPAATGAGAPAAPAASP